MEDIINREIRRIIKEEMKQLRAELTAAAAPPSPPGPKLQPTQKATCKCICLDPVWTTDQVAEFMGLSVKTIRNRLSKGTFPQPRKHGRLNAFLPSEVIAYQRQVLGLDET